MKQLLLAMIRIYWGMLPFKRANCLFKEPCSHYIYDQTAEHGFNAGIKAMKYRYCNCRRGYSLFKHPVTGETQMLLKYGDIITEDKIAKRFLKGKK